MVGYRARAAATAAPAGAVSRGTAQAKSKAQAIPQAQRSEAKDNAPGHVYVYAGVLSAALFDFVRV